VRPIIYGNTHMQNINRRSALLKDYDRLETVYPLVNNEFYHPIEKPVARRQLNIDSSKKFILFFGCSVLSEERKGMRYLMEALTLFHEQLTEEQRHSVLLLIAGQFAEEIISKMPFEYRYLGYVDLTQLPTIYSAATAFVCPSVDDAGPSMVNQSLSCGTPIISFNIGTAIDMVLGQDTGYCAHLRDAADLEKGMMQLFNSTEERYQEICENCRKIALERTTDASFVKTLQALYEKYRL
jgi:glycosyltransferase involved in cell wall biosynthesis